MKVLRECDNVDEIKYDETGKRWAQVTIKVPVEVRKLLMVSMVEALADVVLLRSVPGTALTIPSLSKSCCRVVGPAHADGSLLVRVSAGIAKAYVSKKKNNDTGKEDLWINTNGLNFGEIFARMSGSVDLNQI
jgi:hypothetical protein